MNMDNNFLQYNGTCIYISVYSAFSDRIGLPLPNITSPGVLMKSIEAVLMTGCPSWQHPHACIYMGHLCNYLNIDL